MMLDGGWLLLLFVTSVGFLMGKVLKKHFLFRMVSSLGLLLKMLWERWEYSREKWNVMVRISINGC